MKNKRIIMIIALILSVSTIGNVVQFTINHKLKEQASSLQEKIEVQEADVLTLKEQINRLQSSVEAYENQKEKYWTLASCDYKISLQEGVEENTLDLVQYIDEEERILLTFREEYDYLTPEDISAESFEECLGHRGFCLYKRHSTASFYFYEVDYYAIEEEFELLAYRWGSRDQDFYEVDVDGDGVDELICNVMWMGDGAMDALIYHFDGEKVLRGRGSDLLDEPIDFYGVGSIMTEYLWPENKVHITYWLDEVEGFIEKDYDIDLRKLKLSEYIK